MRISYSDLVDIPKLQALLVSFSQVSGIANAVIDVDGSVIVHAGWQDACTAFHRVNAGTCRRCIESDTSLAERMTRGHPYAIYRCHNGLVDAAAPIIVNGEHVANVFTGQFLTEAPDIDFFRRQARQFGFDETRYLQAIAKLPVLTQERAESLTRLYAQLAAMLADNGLDRLRQKEAAADLAKLNAALETTVLERTLALRQSEDRYRLLIATATQGILVAQGAHLQFVNPMVSQLTGYSEEELLSIPFMEFVHRDDRELMRSNYLRRLNGEAADNEYAVRIFTKGGCEKWVEISGAKVEWEGQPATLNFVTDITQRKGVEAKLLAATAEAEKANNAKSRFLAAASHDLRQPLAALSLYVGALNRNGSPEDRDLVMSVESCVASLSELLTDILDVSKLDAGVVTPRLSSFSVDELLGEIISVQSIEAKLKGIQLRWRDSGAIGRSDRPLMTRIISNLVANAIRYTDKGAVLVACRRHRGKQWVEVWDTGIGVPQDKAGLIFDEFRQLGDGARSRGSGLGLSIVAKTAAVLGLEVRLKSRLGKGSMFAIELPLGAKVVTETSLSVTSKEQRSIRIGVVDDAVDVLKALSLALERNGHDVVAARTGRLLLECLGDTAPDVVIADFRLADGETGFDVIKAVRRLFGEDLPAIVITGDTDPALVRSMADRGIAVHYKPLQTGALLAFIEEATELAGAWRRSNGQA